MFAHGWLEGSQGLPKAFLYYIVMRGEIYGAKEIPKPHQKGFPRVWFVKRIKKMVLGHLSHRLNQTMRANDKKIKLKRKGTNKDGKSLNLNFYLGGFLIQLH